MDEASSSSSLSAEHEEQQQPRVIAGALNIFKDPRQQKSKTNRGKKCEICTPIGHFFLEHRLSNDKAQYSDKEKEQPQQVSHWSEDIENSRILGLVCLPLEGW